MKRFARLYEELDATTRTLGKVEALVRYFGEAPPEDAAWGLFFLVGQRLKRLVPTRVLVEALVAEVPLPDWLLEECYAAVGDLAEVVALLVDAAHPLPESRSDLSLRKWLEERVLPLYDLSLEEQRERVRGWYRELSRGELYLLGKVLTGEMRVGVSHKLVVRALARFGGVPEETIAHRLMGTWTPTAASFRALFAGETASDASRPYPFFLASPLEEDVASLGDVADWLVEWKWDGIRAQLVKRAGKVWIWSRGEDLVTDRFPEVRSLGDALPDGTVLDGEVLAWRGEGPLPFGTLQRRIGRIALDARTLAEAPLAFMAYDLLEEGGVDVRALPQSERRARLERLVAAHPGIKLSPLVTGSWEELARVREESRARGVEGFLLKRRSAPYRTGRKRGDWWKWKIDPDTLDCVLVYSQPGHGRRATLYTDHTFAVWSEGALVPIAKAYSGLTDDEVDELDAWIRGHTREKHGPVRVVEPFHVFEIAFEGIAVSKRHKAGIAVRFPRIARWRRDKPAAEADTLENARRLLSGGMA